MITYLEKELFIRFTASAFRKLPSIYVFSYFPFGFEGRMWDLIVSVPDHCLSFYLSPFISITPSLAGIFFSLSLICLFSAALSLQTLSCQ